MLTYAQNFEDVMLARLFADQATGFYIDIGASDPQHFSVTKHFYDLGWRGINVEPIPAYHAALLRERPRDLNLGLAIAAEAGTRSFFEAPGYDGLSTLDLEQVTYLRQQGYPIVEYEVATMTADELFEQHVEGTVDFLKVDVEGAEVAVLQQLDLTRHRPRVLLIESTAPGRQFAGWDALPECDRAWEAKLLAADYVFAYFDGLNSFYLRDEDAVLARRLQVPPGVYDDIHRPPDPALVAECERLQAALAALTQDQAIARTAAQTAETKLAQAETKLAQAGATLAQAEAAQAQSLADLRALQERNSILRLLAEQLRAAQQGAAASPRDQLATGRHRWRVRR